MTGRRTRMAATVIVTAMLCAGTLWGDDDNFPFGPFRMYSTEQELDGEVRAMEVEGLTPSGEWVALPFENDFGLRRADIEGQLRTLGQPPGQVLTSMARAYERLGRGEHEVDAFRLLERTYDLEDGVSVSEQVRTLATYRRD